MQIFLKRGMKLLYNLSYVYTPLFLFWFQRTCVFFPLSHRYNQMPFCHLHPLRWKISCAQGDDVIMSENTNKGYHSIVNILYKPKNTLFTDNTLINIKCHTQIQQGNCPSKPNHPPQLKPVGDCYTYSCSKVNEFDSLLWNIDDDSLLMLTWSFHSHFLGQNRFLTHPVPTGFRNVTSSDQLSVKHHPFTFKSIGVIFGI